MLADQSCAWCAWQLLHADESCRNHNGREMCAHKFPECYLVRLISPVRCVKRGQRRLARSTIEDGDGSFAQARDIEQQHLHAFGVDAHAV